MPYVLRISEPLEFDENDKPKLDPSDPRIRKLVYSMYRDMLSNRNTEANQFISQKDPSCVTQDGGVIPIVDAIIRQGSSGSGGTTSTTSPAPPPLPSTNGTTGIPPPPPMAPPGSLPAVRLNSEVGPLNKGPPKQIQGAMLKDKKPFTYTPGGIDMFSEIRSPRMAQRIKMNASAEGVTSVPTPQVSQHDNLQRTQNLTPAAIAAMQPLLPVAVFPQGSLSQASLHRTNKPIDLTIRTQASPTFPTGSNTIPPPPPQQLNTSLEHGQESDVRPISPRPPPISLAAVMNQSIRNSALTPDETQVQSHLQTERLVSPPQQQMKAQAPSQQIGSIYIPSPPQQPLTSTGERSQPPQMNTNALFMKKNPICPESDPDRDTTAENKNSGTTTPLTPQLNKAPTPWLNSQNRLVNQANSPEGTKQGTPWGESLNNRAMPIHITRETGDDHTERNNFDTQYQLQNGRPFPVHDVQVKGPFIEAETNRRISQPQAAASSGMRIIPIEIRGQTSHQDKTQAAAATKQMQKQAPVYSKPTGIFPGHQSSGTTIPMKRSEQHEGIDRMTISLNEGYRADPIQSKSFKVIQRITDDDEQVAQQKLELKGEDKQLMDSIKTKVDESSLHQTTEPRFRGGHIPSRSFQALRNHLPPSPDTREEVQVFPGKPGPVTHNIQIQMATDSPIQTFQHCYNPGSMDVSGHQHKQNPEPTRFTGGNIPSRSFKMLQALNPENDPGPALEGSTPAGVIKNDNKPSPATFPPESPSPSTMKRNDPTGDKGQTRPVDMAIDQYNSDWDAYWYYYWYWANYWQSLGYECPPPEWESTTEYETPVSIPSKTFKTLQRAFENKKGKGSVSGTNLPEIELKCCDNNQKPKSFNSTTEHVDNNGDKRADKKTKHLESIIEDESTEINECPSEAESFQDSESDTNLGIVEEPSEDTDVFTSISQNPSLDECTSDSEPEEHHCHRTDRLSTIDELSETERASSSRTSFETADKVDESDYLSARSEDEDTFDEDSSVSVIENVDTGHTTAQASDSSTTLSSSEEDFEEDVEVESSVTVRLPLRRSFTKSRSYRDITTVLVGAHEPQASPLLEAEEQAVGVPTIQKDSNCKLSDDMEPTGCVVNDGEINLTEAISVFEVETARPVKILDSNDKLVEDIDFWGEIIGQNSEDEIVQSFDTCNVTQSAKSFTSKLNDNEFNFWDKPEHPTASLNALEHHGQFKLSEEFVDALDQNPCIHVDTSSQSDCTEIKHNNTRRHHAHCEPETEPNVDSKINQNSQDENRSFQDVNTKVTKDFETDCNVEAKNSTHNGYQYRLSEDSTVELLSASDETSDESSSRSSSATVTLKFNKNTKSSPALQPENHRGKNLEQVSRLRESMEATCTENEVNHMCSLKASEDVEDDTTEDHCPVIRMPGKTENLLWRIERFLQQSFTSLGSEEDSGVMTDQSRQISDAETDNDDVSIKSQPSAPATSVVKTVESTENGSISKTSVVEQQRRALYCERAKTHSRLFQLLQEECDREDEEESSARTDSIDSSSSTRFQKAYLSPMSPTDSCKRFLPGSDSGLSVDSGSLTSSSGLLSPMNREQILVDIINQFQSRQIRESDGSIERRLFSTSVFPSKIFKLLHDEFGEEFYDAFDFNEVECCEYSKNSEAPTKFGRTNEHCQLLKGNKSESVNENNTANIVISENGKRRKRGKCQTQKQQRTEESIQS